MDATQDVFLRRRTMQSTLRESFRGQARGVFVGQVGLRLVLCALALLLTVSFVVAGPLAPLGAPPAGQVWVQAGGQWILVPAPTSDGPYEYVQGGWVPIQVSPPPGTEWIPAHWGPNGWVPGHWAPIPAPLPGLVWVPGRWAAGRWVVGYWAGTVPAAERWVPGHWEGRVWVPAHWAGRSPTKEWVPGHWGPRGRWRPGHWR